MASRVGLRTNRLLLRRWTEADRAPLAVLNADPDVMEFYQAPLTSEESSAFIDRIESHFAQRGFELWAVEIIDRHQFAGYVGLWPANFEATFTPAGEVGWRLSHAAWGRGFAPEAARAAMTDGFRHRAFRRSCRSPRRSTSVRSG
jgi:RimJ/RimL family protein N-acetyltransferase